MAGPAQFIAFALGAAFTARALHFLGHIGAAARATGRIGIKEQAVALEARAGRATADLSIAFAHETAALAVLVKAVFGNDRLVGRMRIQARLTGPAAFTGGIASPCPLSRGLSG